MKLMYRHAVLLACSLGLLLLPTGCYEVSVSFEPSKPVAETFSPLPTQATSQLQKNESSSISLEKANASSLQTVASTPTDPILTPHHNSNGKALHQGSLRMSNQTEQPLRLALLARARVKGSDAKKTNYDVPAHWDFAPQEGSEKGLILSLPNGKFQMEKGDILVAFAQDGSRRYWGPYVVGETSSPTWNSQKGEWQLVLTP